LPDEEKINEAFADSLGKALGIDDKMRRHKVDEGKFKISFENNPCANVRAVN
jgi:hypothetical protein